MGEAERVCYTPLMTEPLDIKSFEPGPSGILGNFAPHPFVLDNIHFACMEAFLQSLKIKDPQQRQLVYSMNGHDAKAAGTQHHWQDEGKLYFKDQIIDRFGPDYQALLDRAYTALAAQNQIYRETLISTGTRPLIHTVGKDDPRETVLTEKELCDRLMQMRAALTR
jgi:predicted NAD-dependent protein-ADP-ribosyltransferase YbiA (DUF1768 family)